MQAIKSQNVKTESTNQTDAATNNNLGSTVTDATNGNTGNAVSGTLNDQAQEGQSIHVAASVGVNVTEHSAKTEIKGNLTVGGLKAEVENTGNFSTASTGAAISEATNSNCVGAAVAVSVNGNKALLEIGDGIQIVITGTPADETEEDADTILGNVALNTILNQNSTGDALGRYGALAVAGSSSGKGGKVGLAGSIAVMVAKGTSAILLGDNVSITGTIDEDGEAASAAGSVTIDASDKSKLSAAALAATKSDGSTAGVGASFALLYAKNEVLAEAGDNFTVSANDFSMTATKQAVDITDFEPDASVSDFITVLEVDSNGDGGYSTDDADKYGMIVLQKNQNGSYTVFTNLDTGNILNLIQLTSVLASVNYYASAVAGTVMERKGDTSNQKAAVAGAVSMLFNDSVTRVTIGNNAKITTGGEARIEASSETNTRLLGGALSSSGAKAGIGLNVATVRQNDLVNATVGNAPVIVADSFRVSSESISDMLVITAAAVNASGTSVGGALNVVINNTGAKSEIGDNGSIVTSADVEILSKVKSNVTLGSVTVSISGSQNQGASVGAIVSVTTNASAAEALVGDSILITSESGAITVSAVNEEQVISVLAAVARSGNGGAGAGTLSVLTTDARAIAGIGDYAKLTASEDITIRTISKAKLIDLMLAAAASTDAPAVGATIMVNVFNRETGAYIGDYSILVSRNGNVLVQADSEETAVIVSVAGAAASQNAISGNIQVNVGTSKTYASVGDNVTIKAWDSIGVTANQDSTVVAISPTVSYGSNSTAVGATVQTNILSSEVKAVIGQNANLIAYAQPSTTNGVLTANRESKRKGIILSALAKDLVVAGGVSASAGKNAVAGVVETLVNKTVVLANLGANAVVRAGFRSGDAVDGAFSGNTPSEQEGELSAEADAHSTLVLFGGAFSATSSTGVGATVLTLVYDKKVDAQILLSIETPSYVSGDVNVIAGTEDLVALVSVNFGVSNTTAANVGGNVLIFQNQVNAQLTGNLAAGGNVTVQADSVTDLINAIASVSGSLGGTAVSGAALVTYFQGITTASVGAQSEIDAFALYVLAASSVNINSDGVGLTASVGSAAVSGLVNIIVTSTVTKAYIDDGSKVMTNFVTVTAIDNYDLTAVAVSLSGGSNGIGVTAVVTVAKNTVLAYIGDNTSVQCVKLTVNALSNRNIRNYAGSVAAGATAGAGVTVMVAVIGGMLDQDSANGIAKGFKPDDFMNGIKSSVPNAAKNYLESMDLSADIEADDAKASDLQVGDNNGNYSGTDDYRNDDFDKNYNSGTNPGENFSEDVTNTDGSELGMAKPEGEYRNVIQAYIGSGCDIIVSGATLVEAIETLNVDIVTASAAIGGTAGVNVGVAVVVAYSNVLAEIRNNTIVNCGDLTVHAVSGGDGSIDADRVSEVLEAAGIDADANGSSIRVIAITVGIGGTAGVSPSVAVLNMATSTAARMDGVVGDANIITVKAENIYPQVLAVTGAIGIGGTAGVSASVAVVTFNSDTYAGIANSELSAAELNILSNVDNTAKAYALSLGGGAVGINGGVAVVTNRSTTNTVLNGGNYTIRGDVEVSAVVNANAESYIVGMALGGVAVGLNGAVVNQHAKIYTQIQGNIASSLVASGNVTVSNDVAATAKTTVITLAGGGVGVGGNVLLVFNNIEAIAAIINMPFTVSGNVTVTAGMNADAEAVLASATVGGVAVGLSTSYVGLNAKNLAYLEVLEGAICSAASIRIYAGSTGKQNSFNAAASTVAGGVAGVNVGLNAAVADIHATNEAKILSKGLLVGSVDVQANSAATALAEIYFASAGGINVSSATAVSLLRINQLAEADIAAIDQFAEFNVSSVLNADSGLIPSHAKLVTVSGGIYSASANVAVAYGLSSSIARVILHTGTNGGNMTVNASGSADAKSETLNQSTGLFSGSVYVNVAYAKGQFQSVLEILDQVSAISATVQTIYTANANADLTPSASKLNLSLASFNVNLAIARSAANGLAALEGNGKLVLVQNLLVKADSSNSTAYANINGATVNASGYSFGVNVSDTQMALEQTVRIHGIRVEAGGRIEILCNANNLASTAQTGSNGGVGISLAGGTVNTASAKVSAVNQIVLDNAMLTAHGTVQTKASSNNLAVNAIAKALTFTLSGVSAAVTNTEATVTRFNTGVFINNGSITGSNVEALSTATGSKVVAQSSVPRFSGSIIGAESILATAKLLEKLTQVIVNAGTIRATAADVILSANADTTLKADSAHPAVSVGAITIKDYRFNIEVDKLLTEVIFDGQIDANNVSLTAFDSVSGDIRMDDTTVGGFTGTTGIAKINVKNQTAHVKSAGKIKAIGNILVEARADQKFAADVDTSSKNFNDHGYAKTDIIVYRNAIVEIGGELISGSGNIDVKAQLDSIGNNDKVIYIDLDIYLDTWIDSSTYPTGTGKLVSVAKVNVAEGSLIQAMGGDDNSTGTITIVAKSEGNVLVEVYRYVDKIIGGNRAYSVADVSETVQTIIGGSSITRIFGRNVNIRALTEMDVRSKSHAVGNTSLSVYYPNAKVNFCVDLDTIIRGAEISAQKVLNISAYLPSTYVLGYCISDKIHFWNGNYPSVTINGHIYGDVTFDNYTILRAEELNVKTFQPADAYNKVKIERLAESYWSGDLDDVDEHTVFDTTSHDTLSNYRTSNWIDYSYDRKFVSGTYNPYAGDVNFMFYSGKLIWSDASASGAANPSGKTEIYLGSGATDIYVNIGADGQVHIVGLNNKVDVRDAVYLLDGVYHVDGSKLLHAITKGLYSFKYETVYNNYLMDQNATNGGVTVLNSSNYAVQLDNVNQLSSKPGADLNVTYTNSDADLIVNGGGNFSNGSIFVDLAGGNLILINGAQINAQNIVILDVESILDESREDGKVVITNSGYNGNSANSGIHIVAQDALNLLLQTVNSSYTIHHIKTDGDLTLEVVNTEGKKMPVVLGELVSGGNVNLKVPHSVENADPNKVAISGNSINVNAGANVGTSSKYLLIDSSVSQTGGVTVNASGGIYLKEAVGDLHIAQISNTGTGNISIWTQDGSIYTDPAFYENNGNHPDGLEKLNESIIKYTENTLLWSDMNDTIQVLLQYLVDLTRIRHVLETEGEDALETVKKEVDVLHYVESVEEALENIAVALALVGGYDYQDPEKATALYESALEGDTLTDTFNSEVDRINANLALGGLLGVALNDWRNYYLQMDEYYDAIIESFDNLNNSKVNISVNGDLELHLQSSTGVASVSKEINTMLIAVGGKVTITTAKDTVLKDVHLESDLDLKLDPIVATGEINLHSLVGIYVADMSNQVLLDCDTLELWALFGDLGTAYQPLILKTNLLRALGSAIYMESPKDLLVDMILGTGDVYLTVQGDILGQKSDNVSLNGIYGMGINLQVSGDIGKEWMEVLISPELYLNVIARNLYMTADGNVMVGTIRTDGMVSINASHGAIQKADQGSGIWCKSLNLHAYGMIGTDGEPLMIFNDGKYTSNGGGLKRSLFRASPARDTLTANSDLYGENVRIVPAIDLTTDVSAVHAGFHTATVSSGIGGVRVTGSVPADAVLVLSDVSDHADCSVCRQLMDKHQRDGWIFGNLEIVGGYAGMLQVEIPATGELAAFEGREVVILTCRDGVVWAVRATVINGYITFYTEELGSFLVLGDADQLKLTEDGTHVVLDQTLLPFGGWL